MKSQQQTNAFPAELAGFDDSSQFLTLDPQIKQKLDNIDRMKQMEEDKENTTQSLKKTHPPKKQKKVQSHTVQKSKPVHRDRESLEEVRRNELRIKEDFKDKLKVWKRQRQELSVKKHVFEQKKAQKRAEEELRRREEAQEAKKFEQAQRKKQLQQKINDIQERRRRREESLKNAVLKRSYHRVPKYLERQKNFSKQQHQKTEIDLRVLKNRKERMKMDPQSLKKHQKAYIQRIKERLNMRNEQCQPQQRRTKSDFNLYLRRSQELKNAELSKIIRRKKYEQKLSSVRVRVDELKRQEVLITRDKAKHPHKYNLLGQKGLTDRQIYEDFQDFDIKTDSKHIGNHYLEEQKNFKKSPNRGNRREKICSVAALPPHPSQPASMAVNSRHGKPMRKRLGSVELPKVETSKSTRSISNSERYTQGLDRTRHIDKRYFKALNAKLSAVI